MTRSLRLLEDTKVLVYRNKFNKFHSQISDLESQLQEKILRMTIQEKIEHGQKLILENKTVSAEKTLQVIRKLVSKIESPEFSNQVSSLELQLDSLKNNITQKVDKEIDHIKSQFIEIPDIYKSHEIKKLLNDNEIPENEKTKLKQECNKLDYKYKKGVIPEQHRAFVKYDIQNRPNNGYYAFYIAPSINSEIFPYRRRKIELRGYTEEVFEKKLRHYFTKSSSNYKVLGDVSIQSAEGIHPYEPDIAIIETSDEYGIRIDIEIDEPYSGYDKTPIHHIGCGDMFRDRNLVNLGWIVIRFSERQIYQEADNCIYYIQELIHSIDPKFNITCDGHAPSSDKCWTEVEANIMAINNYRENLLQHKFREQKEEQITIDATLTDDEKEVSKRIRPIYIPKKVPHNIDESDTRFDKDSLISFDPAEHIYLYNGRTQLTAVSDVVNHFFIPFNSIGISKRTSIRRGVSQCKIIEEWDSKGQESREIGTFLHTQIESYFSKKPMIMETHFHYNGQYVNIEKNVSIENEILYFKNYLENKSITPFRSEWHIYDLDLKIAGTIDLLCRNGNHYDIYDWKRSRRASPNEKIWNYGINGLEKVPDIPFYHYALQQNLYKHILEKNYGIIVDNMYIVVLHQEFYDSREYKIPEMDAEMEIILKYLSNRLL